MTLRYYRNGPARSLSFPIALSTDTSMTVDSAAGFPTQFPYTLIIEPDTALEEVVDVTAAVGNVLTITRGVDSTTASAHAAGSVVYHGISARDPREANAHVNATTNVHGITGGFVDTDSVQTIVGEKTFTGGLKTPAGDVVTVGGTQTITGDKTFSTVPHTAANGDVATLGGSQTFTGTKTFTNTVQTGTETHSGTETHAGTIRFTHVDMAAKVAANSTDEVTGSATYSAGSTPVGVPFVAPPSGRILVMLSCWLQQDITDQTAIASFGIYTGSTPGAGTEIVAPSQDRAVMVGGTVTTGVPIRVQAGRTSMVVGLTAGTQYVATVMFQTTTPGTAHIFNREIIVLPLAG